MIDFSKIDEEKKPSKSDIRTYTITKNEISQAVKNGSKCDKCGDKKIVPKFEYAENYGRYILVFSDCECKKRVLSENNINQSGLKNLIDTKKFDNFKRDTDFQDKIYNKAVEYLKQIRIGKKLWFFIGGQSGCGKTHICSAISGRFLRNNYTLKYMCWVNDLRSFKSNIKDNTELESIKNCDVLYIDDLFKGSKAPTDYEIGVAYEIFNHRYNNDLITIVSSECDINQLCNIDEAIAGRIKEKANGFVINIDKDINKNYRLKK